MVRLLQIFIVLFWIATTGWLIRTVWAPRGAGFVEMDKKEAIDAFFNWNEADSFSIIENGRRIGQATISAGSAPDDKNGGKIVNAFSMIGSLYENPSQAGPDSKIIISWRIAMEFDDLAPMNLQNTQVNVKLPTQRLISMIDLMGDPPMIRARVTVADIPVFQYSGSADEMPSIPPSLLSGEGSKLLSSLKNNHDALLPEITAKRGSASFGGRELPVFLIELKPPLDGTNIRIFLSQAGEPLKIETDFGIEAISDVLVPLKAFKDSVVP